MAESNPYAPPADLGPPPESARPLDGRPEYKLYGPGHAMLATFLGSPAAGLYLVSVNRRRLGLAQSATTTLVAGFVATGALLAAAFLLPEGVGRVLPIAATIAVGQYAKQDAPLLDAHLGRGGLRESGWKAAGIGLVSMVAVLAVMFAIALIAAV